MKIALIYISPNSTTKNLSAAMKNALIAMGHTVTTINIGEKSNREFSQIEYSQFKDVDIIGIGCPVYHLRPIAPMEKFLQEALPKMATQNPNLKAFVYLTYSGITTGKAFLLVLKHCMRNHIGFIGGAKFKAPHFLDTKGYPGKETKDVINEFCMRLDQKDFKAISPKEAQAVFKKRKTIINIIFPLSKVIGKLRQQKITILPELCIGCKKCANACPVGAIEMAGTAKRNAKTCIYCYHCAVICPKKAIVCDVKKVYDVVELNRKIVGTETPQNNSYL